jgi:hypothetical protein
MDKLPIDIKYKIASWIFNSNTIIFLTNNGYDFKPELHKYTLKSLIDSKDEIFKDLILNGLYDDNYFWIHNFKYKENKEFNDNYKDLLFLMADKNIRDEKYFKGLIKSSKKNLNLIDKKNNTMALHHYISKLYPEYLICNLIGNHKLFNIDVISPTKKGSKCLEMCWKKHYDLLLTKILQTTNTIKINNFLANKINTNDYKYFQDNFPNSIPYIYKLASVSTQKVNSSNAIFYLNVTNSYFPKDYEKVLRSGHLFDLILNKLYMISMYILSNTNTDVSNELFNKIDFTMINNESIKNKYSKFYDDILLIGLVKSYEFIVYGTFNDDSLPIVINTIISHYKLDIEYRNIDYFKNKIKTIISKIKQISNINDIKETFLLRVIENRNEQYAKNIIDKLSFNKFNNESNNSEIIHRCLEYNLDNLIIYMIIKDKIDLLKIKNYLDSNKINNDFSDSFFALLFRKNKNELIMKIVNDNLISKKITRSDLVFSGLCLSIVHNKLEIFVELIENYKHCIAINKLFETFTYSKKYSDSIIYYIIKNKMDDYLDWVLNKYFLASTTVINFKICDNNGDSILSLLIEYDYSIHIEKIINKLGKDIFKHVPMFTLNNVNLSYASQLSNGKELYWACNKKLNNIAWFFVSNNLGNINYFDSEGYSSLMLACKYNMNTIAGYLLNSNLADWRRKNNLGKSSLDYAKENNMSQIIQIIEEKQKEKQNKQKSPLQSHYNCETNKKMFEEKEIIIENIGDFSKIFDVLKSINKK